MAVAFIALLAALSGTALALPGSNTVTSGDIRNGQVRSADIRNNDVRGGDVRTNTLTGSDIAESSLATVPRAGFATTAGSARSAGQATNANNAAHATSADNATTAGDARTVRGSSIQTFSDEAAEDGGFDGIDIGGVGVGGDCNGGDFNLDARNTSGESAAFFVEGVDNSGQHVNDDDEFASDDGDPIVRDDASDGSGTATVIFADGKVTTIIYAFTNGGVLTDGCLWSGQVISNR